MRFTSKLRCCVSVSRLQLYVLCNINTKDELHVEKISMYCCAVFGKCKACMVQYNFHQQTKCKQYSLFACMSCWQECLCYCQKTNHNIISHFRMFVWQECNHFKAGDKVRSTVSSKRLAVTGIFGSVCKHEIPMKFCDMKHGERLALY